MSGRRGGPIRQMLPNGLSVLCQSKVELRHFYSDIFEHRVYAKNGITLAPGATVLDVGANIGMFSMFAQETFHGVRVFAFEPAPPLFAILSENVARYGGSVRCFNLGMAREPGEAILTFYPNSSGMSSLYPDEAEERQTLVSLLENEARQGVAEVQNLLPYLDDYLAVRLTAEQLPCRLTTVSAFLAEQGIAAVDLLKVDVQKAEWEILLGIGEGDWPKIAQVVMEVHDLGGRVARVEAHLAARGFRVVVEQDDLYVGSGIYNLYGLRQGQSPR
jgi:phthiocerol/phenolphthiocerol synthesis type-I polyketide synthase E